MPRYKVLSGTHFHEGQVFKPGDIVELPEALALPFAFKLELVPDIPEATERAAEIASEHGINLEDISGTGKDGKILVKDVEALIVEPEQRDTGSVPKPRCNCR